MTRRASLFTALTCLGTLSVFTFAQEPEPPSGPPFDFTAGPLRGELGEHAVIDVGADGVFLDGANTAKFLTVTQNTPSGDEIGTILINREAGQGPSYFVVFSFDEIGYVKDDEKDKLDADAMLESMREGVRQDNQARQQRGWETHELVGWERPPFYDPRTNNLTWATRIRGASGGESVNWVTSLLGRHGVVRANLVTDPAELTQAVAEFETTIASFEFNSGRRYSEWSTGDKVAAVGLTGLVVGGAGAAAAKLGLLGKFWKLIAASWKVVAIGVIAFGAGLKKLLARFFRSNEGRVPPPPPMPNVG